MKKYRIKSREEMLQIHNEEEIARWDKDVHDMFDTIQEGEFDSDGDLCIGNCYFKPNEFEEIMQVSFNDAQISNLLGRDRLGQGSTSDTGILVDNKEDLLNVHGTATDVGGLPKVSTEYTDKHYDFYYDLTEEEIKNKRIKVDPYFVAKRWKLGEKDPSGCLFHIMKNSSRFGVKNSAEREIKALKDIVKRLEDLNK